VVLPNGGSEPEAVPECNPETAGHKGGAMNSLTFTLRGKMKSGKNEVMTTSRGMRYPKAQFKVWRSDMLEQIGYIARPFVGPVALVVDYVPQDKIRRDAPGILDAICHLLEKAGIVTDDAQVKTIHWTEFVPEKAGHCTVTIKPLDRVKPISV